MTLKAEEEKLIRRYLLGQLAKEEGLLQQVEEWLLEDDEFAQHVEIVGSELIADYVKGALNQEDRTSYERYFRPTPSRLQQFQLSKSLLRYAGSKVSDSTLPVERGESEWLTRLKLFFTPKWQVAIYTMLVLGLGVGIYRAYLYKSEVDRGLSALNLAYRAGRPVESRIGGFNFAPFRLMQGAEEKENVDKPALDLSANLLLNAASEKPNAESLHALGCFYLFRKDFGEAIKQFRAAVEMEPNNARFHNDLGAALFEKGKQDIRDEKGGQGEISEAQEYFNKAVELNNSTLEALFNRSLCYQYQKLYSMAEQSWRQYLQKDSHSKWADEARQNLKLIEERKQQKVKLKEDIYSEFLAAFQSKDPERAWNSFRQGRIREGNLITEALIDSYMDLSSQNKQADADAKLSALTLAAEIEQQRSGDRFTSDIAKFYRASSTAQKEESFKARQKIKYGRELYGNSDFEAAGKIYAEARHKFQLAGNQAEALLAESWSGYCLLRIPRVDQSLYLFNRLSISLEKKKYLGLQVQALNAIADAYTNKAEFSKTLNYARRSLEISELIDDRALMLRNLLSFVSMNLNFGKYYESLNLAHRALEMADKLATNPRQTWPFYHEAAMALYNLNRYAAALDFQKEALTLAEESQMPLLKSRSHARIGLIYEKLRNYDLAVSHELAALNESNNVSDQQIKLNLIANTSMHLGDVYLQIGDIARAINYYDQAIGIYEKRNAHDYLYRNHKGKLLAYLKIKNKESARDELMTTLRLLEQYRPKILEEINRNKFFDVGHDIYDIAINFAFTEMGDPEMAFDYAESSRARTLLDLSLTKMEIAEGKESPTIKLPSDVTTPLPLSKIRWRLPEEVQLVEYAVLEDKLLIWLVTKNTFHSFSEPISGEDLKALARGYLNALKSEDERNSILVRDYAKRLYRILLGKAAPSLEPEKPLYIIPDKILNHLPFASLISSVEDGKPERHLIQDYPIAVSPSVNLFLISSESAQSKAKFQNERILSIGNPKFDRTLFDLPDLPLSKDEAEKIASNYSSSIVLTGKDARKELVKAEMKRSEVVHLSTHAISDENYPLQSKFLLAKDSSISDSEGSLRAHEIYQLRLPLTRLAILSACQTGIEQSFRGEGAIGLARPFISLGVPLVVASLWPVELATTSKLMIGFHRYRTLNGLRTVDALRRAQLDVISGAAPRDRHPMHWSSFVVIGGYAEY